MHNRKPEGFFQYLSRTQRDRITGFFLTNFGWTKIEPQMVYPPWKHPDEYSFKGSKGRRLDEYHFVYISEGGGTVWSEPTGSVSVEAGTFFILFPGIRHHYAPDPEVGWSEQWFGVSGDMAKRYVDFSFSPEAAIQSIGFNTEIMGLFRRIRTMSDERKPGFRRLLAPVAMEILVQMEVVLERGVQSFDEEIDPACFYIEENLGTHIDYEAYAKSIGLSYEAFRKRFKSYTGKAPQQYLLEARIRASKKLLDNTDKTIKEIAETCGFESPYYFSRYFKGSTGLSPRTFRNR